MSAARLDGAEETGPAPMDATEDSAPASTTNTPKKRKKRCAVCNVKLGMLGKRGQRGRKGLWRAGGGKAAAGVARPRWERKGGWMEERRGDGMEESTSCKT